MAAANASLGDLRTWTHHVFTALWSALCPVLLLLATRSLLHLPTSIVTDTGVMFSKAEQLLLPSPLKNDSTLSPGQFVRRIFTPAPYKRLILSPIHVYNRQLCSHLLYRLSYPPSVFPEIFSIAAKPSLRMPVVHTLYRALQFLF